MPTSNDTKAAREGSPWTAKKGSRVGHPATINIAFGGDDWKTLFFTSRTHLGAAVSAAAGCVALSGGVRSASAQAEKRITHLGAVNVKIAGIPVPVPKK